VTRFIQRFNDVWEPDDLATYSGLIAAGSAYHPQFGGINGAWLGDILTRAGMDYVAYDIFEGYRTTILDLNSGEVPKSDRGSFDLVINCGTSEHVLNQYNVFRCMHDAVRVGGLIYHNLPMTGYLTHGYFTYTPMLFGDLARANRYEIVKMDFVGPNGSEIVSEQLVARYADVVRFDASDPVAPRWHNMPVPTGGIAISLRRTTPEPFRASLEATTTAGSVAPEVQRAYQRHDSGAGQQVAGDAAIAAKRATVDQWIRSILDRFASPDLGYREIVRLYDAHEEAYGGGEPFPPLIEKKALELALVEFPQRKDLQARLEQVEESLRERWPLLRLDYDPAVVDERAIAVDGAETGLLSIAPEERQFHYAVAAFRRYLAAGRPECYPLGLELEALRYSAEELYPDDAALKVRYGIQIGKLSVSLTLRRSMSAQQEATSGCADSPKEVSR
jgi:hypothetical protein